MQMQQVQLLFKMKKNNDVELDEIPFVFLVSLSPIEVGAQTYSVITFTDVSLISIHAKEEIESDY